MNNKIFISGRVSGIDYAYAKRLFANAEMYWTKKGYQVVNPTKLCNKKWSWIRCMIVCLWNLAKCRYVYFLPNYVYSRGATIELKAAKLLNKVIYFRYNNNKHIKL
jgi:hypothetical protein